MARSNRSRKRDAEYEPLNLERLTTGSRRTEVRKGREWTVQPISVANATKVYICPGCSLDIAPGVAHLAAWRMDGILGDAADIADRRHWHDACWKVS
jgi:hypothetical protein